MAKIPDDPRIQVGQWYYIGAEKADHSNWLSNINKNITICSVQTKPKKILPPKEDCISFDFRKATVKKINGHWKIVVGRMWLKDFDNSEKEARQAMRIIKHYRMNKQCFVGRPDPSMEYYLVKNKAPTGPLKGEDCAGFSPANIDVKKIKGRWKIVEGSHWIMDFGDKESEGRPALRIIKKYGFRYSCFVGRPHASFKYLRK